VKKIGKREAYRMAIKMAAGHFETMDLAQVFGDDVVDQIDVQPGLAEILDEAQKQVVARIRSLIKE
jgi:hypothetical protein